MKKLVLLTVVLLAAFWVNAAQHTIDANETLAEQYVSSLSLGQTDSLPLAPDVRFNGPLLAKPIEGDRKVHAFLLRITRQILLVEIVSMNTRDNGACLELIFVFEEFADKRIEEVHCLTFENETIQQIQLYFDPREFFSDDN